MQNLTLLEGWPLQRTKRFFEGDTIGFLDLGAITITLWLEVFEEVTGVRLLTEEKHKTLRRWVKGYRRTKQ